MALFLAYRIMDGKLEFSRVPKRLKERVKEILADEGFEDLANEGA